MDQARFDKDICGGSGGAAGPGSIAGALSISRFGRLFSGKTATTRRQAPPAMHVEWKRHVHRLRVASRLLHSVSIWTWDTAAPSSQRTPGALWRGRKAFDE
jgi:hypothetical protein